MRHESVYKETLKITFPGKGDLVGCDISVSGTDMVLKSSSDVKALTYCDLKCIHIPGLMEVLKLYPEFAQTFCSDILHDLTFNLREGYEMEDNGGTSLTLPSISEDDENSEGTTPRSPMSPCLTINRNKYSAATGDENWESKVHQFRRTFQSGHRPTVRFEKLRPAATHPNLRKSWDFFDIRDEIEMTKTSVERLDSQMTSLTQDVANLSQEVRTTLILLQQKFECTVTLPQTTQSCESLPMRKHPGNPSLPRRACSQPIGLPSGDQTARDVAHETLRPHHFHNSETQTDLYLLDDILQRRFSPENFSLSERSSDKSSLERSFERSVERSSVERSERYPLQRTSGCSSFSLGEDKVEFVVGPPVSGDEAPETTGGGLRSPKESRDNNNSRMAAFWRSASPDDQPVPSSSSRFRSSVNGGRDSNARSDVPGEIVVDIDGSTSLRLEEFVNFAKGFRITCIRQVRQSSVSPSRPEPGRELPAGKSCSPVFSSPQPVNFLLKPATPLLPSVSTTMATTFLQQQQTNALVSTLLEQVGIMSKYISTLQIPPPPVIHAAQSTAAPVPPAQSPPTAVISPSQFVTSIVSKSKSQYLLP
ncbi:hypothetical protein JTE90_017780 [Oedothorax gibbosus]|uniref:Uncharacterized protein n=1 Tax=Oedothorax gibbosus TaxID=931172 RepID=A0AAV6UKI8_9ARAC|nr:hypothetical protein JTE90_017780 [Oedothorax gibbosus]